ncbi:hypothetical protein MMC26_007427 [Xylographa opegraphella]|nr:hypothetical protein [Xylographa opegraphella]
MRVLAILLALVSVTVAEILQNGQLRANPYPGQVGTIAITASNSSEWKAYPPNATELSYKGRWDSKYISWWSAPGLKFGFTGDNVAISFGNYTDAGVLVAYRVDGQDWQFSNVTANATYLFITPSTTGVNLTTPANAVQTFEMRVTNWAYGVQLAGVWTSCSGGLVKIPNHPMNIEIIGDSLSAGQYATYEGISSYSWGLGEGFGNVEFSITAYPGICLHDSRCYGNLRGQTYQWLHTSDTSGRAIEIWGDNPELWNFTAHQQANVVVINLGTNDNNTSNNITGPEFYQSYIQMIEEVHSVWPKAQIILISLWNGFGAVGNTYAQGGAFITEIYQVYQYFNSGKYANQDFVYYFNTTGILQHNDINPQYHPTDVGHVKLASHLLQYIKMQFNFTFGATGPEVQHDTLYWNDEQNY